MNAMTKRMLLIVTLIFSMTLILDSCATTKNGKRKCNGQKAIRTPMGNM